MTTTTANPKEPVSQRSNPDTAGTFAKYAKMRVLIIDDEPANVALLEGILGDSGYNRVQSITDSRNAINTCATFQPDLILLDLMMPHVDGLTILEGLRSQPGDIFLPVL